MNPFRILPAHFPEPLTPQIQLPTTLVRVFSFVAGISPRFFDLVPFHTGLAVFNRLTVKQLLKKRLAFRTAFYNRTVITATSLKNRQLIPHPTQPQMAFPFTGRSHLMEWRSHLMEPHDYMIL